MERSIKPYDKLEKQYEKIDLRILYDTYNPLKEIESEWLSSITMEKILNPTLGIISGWGATMDENYYMDALVGDKINLFNFNPRGLGKSTKKGTMNNLEAALDANLIFENAFLWLDSFNMPRNKMINPQSPKYLMGICFGAIAIAEMYEKRMSIVDEIDGVIIPSPTSKYHIPFYLKPLAWLPSPVMEFVKRTIGKMIIKYSPGYTPESRKIALHRLKRYHTPTVSRQFRNLFLKTDVTDSWKTIDVPAVSIINPTDPLIPIDWSLDVHRRLKYPIWIELESPDHMVLPKRQKEIKSILLEFTRDPWDFYEKYKHLNHENYSDYKPF